MLPNIIAGVIGVCRRQYQNPISKQIVCTFMMILATVACGNQIIHERYRIIVIPWIVISQYVGRYTNVKTKAEAKLLLEIAIVAAIVLYVLVKFM